MDGPPTELVARAALGDRKAFAQLLETQYDFILRTAWKWTRNQADAEDVAQEACVRLAKAITRFKGEGRFTTWLYALVLNVARDAGRKTRREAAKGQAWLVTEGISQHGRDDVAEDLWHAVDRLPDKQKDVVILVYSEGLTHAQTADILGLAEATVSWHLHEARKSLKTMLRQEAAHG